MSTVSILGRDSRRFRRVDLNLFVQRIIQDSVILRSTSTLAEYARTPPYATLDPAVLIIRFAFVEGTRSSFFVQFFYLVNLLERKSLKFHVELRYRGMLLESLEFWLALFRIVSFCRFLKQRLQSVKLKSWFFWNSIIIYTLSKLLRMLIRMYIQTCLIELSIIGK